MRCSRCCIGNCGQRHPKEESGKGDIKLLMAHGFLCGTNIVFSTLLLALLCCAVFSAGMVLLKKCTAKDHLAFGPFLYVGYAVMLFFTIY